MAALNNAPDATWVGPFRVVNGYVLVGVYATADLPVGAPEGAIAYDITLHKLVVRGASSWVAQT